MDMCEFEHIICTQIFPSYTPLTLGQTYLDIIMPIFEWFVETKGGKVKAKSDDLIVGDRVYKKVSADQVGWL